MKKEHKGKGLAFKLRPSQTITIIAVDICHHDHMSYSGCAKSARVKGRLLDADQLKPELMGLLNHLGEGYSLINNTNIKVFLLSQYFLNRSLDENLRGKLRIFVGAIKAKHILRFPIGHLVDPVAE